MTRHLIYRLALLSGLAGPVLLFQATGCTLLNGLIQQSVLLTATQTVAFALDQVVLAYR